MAGRLTGLFLRKILAWYNKLLYRRLYHRTNEVKMFNDIQRRDRQLLIKLTADERQAIEKAARGSGMSMSEVVRRMIRDGFRRRSANVHE